MYQQKGVVSTLNFGLLKVAADISNQMAEKLTGQLRLIFSYNKTFDLVTFQAKPL